MTGKIIQITTSINTGLVHLYALCDDGTIYFSVPHNNPGKEIIWTQIK
jgi:hypothetical protein